MPTPVRTSPYTQYNVRNPMYGPSVPKPVEGTTPAPAVTPPYIAAGQEQEWWKQRGGHELYDIFAKIEAENPMAARAFWDAVRGQGRGQNDLMAATIHKKFGGDMNAYNNWRNLYHHSGLDSYAGNFDLKTGKWTPGAGFNSQYVKDRTGWDVAGPWQASWNWGDYKNNLKPGLQSTPGNEEAGAESWNTYLHGSQFGTSGVTYPSPYEQAVGSGIIQPNPSVTTPAPATRRMTPNPYVSPTQRGAPTPAPVAPPPARDTTPPSTPVNPYPTTPVNPHGTRGYQYNPNRR